MGAHAQLLMAGHALGCGLPGRALGSPHRAAPFASSRRIQRTLPSCARIVCSAASDGRKKAARQRKEATDSAQQGVDKVADVIKSRAEKAEDALPSSTMGGTFRADAGSASAAPKQGIDDIADVIKSRADKAEGALPSSTTGGTFRPDASPSASTKQGVDDTADTLKVGAGQAQDAVNNPRGAVGDAARSTRSNVDDAADSLKDAVQSAEGQAGSQRPSVSGASENVQEGIDSTADTVKEGTRQAQEYAAEPEKAVDDAAENINKGVDQAAETVSEGIDQAREYAENPTEAVSDAAEGAESAVDSIADALKAGLRNTAQAASDTADAAEDAAQDARSQSEPRVGARPLNVTYKSGAGATVQDTTTSGGSEATAAASLRAEDTARQADAQVDRTAADLEANIDEAAEQTQAVIGAVSERLEGAIEDAPRQTASVVQSVVASAADSIRGAQRFVDSAAASAGRTAGRVESAADDMSSEGGQPAPFASTPLTSIPSFTDDKETVSYFKKRLMFCMAGLDRGFAANATAVKDTEAAIYSLVGAAGGAPTLSYQAPEGGNGDKSTMSLLSGTWRLVYSSAFASGSLGGFRPGPQAALVPVTIGQVYQVISTIATLDNVVEFYFRNQLPSLPGLPPAEPIVATARLRHSLEIQSGSTVRITFENTELKTTGGLGGVLSRLPEVTLPQLPEQLQPSRRMRSSTFEVIYLDDDLRITRGDRGELRVFVRSM
ncbi:g6587 [Coccomyxa viridis]|uniref:G6587 protein n=1 Tax=Coccomyxa viridis TaxID=1274662 RepID=A0ABP1FWZ7_9CHLO